LGGGEDHLQALTDGLGQLGSVDLAGAPGHLSLGFGQRWNRKRRKLREVENGAKSASCDLSALAIKEKSAQQEEGEGGLLRIRRREVC